MEILQSLRSFRMTLTKGSLRMTEAKESLRMTIGGELGDLNFDIAWNLGFGTICSCYPLGSPSVARLILRYCSGQGLAATLVNNPITELVQIDR